MLGRVGSIAPSARLAAKLLTQQRRTIVVGRDGHLPEAPVDDRPQTVRSHRYAIEVFLDVIEELAHQIPHRAR